MSNDKTPVIDQAWSVNFAEKVECEMSESFENATNPQAIQAIGILIKRLKSWRKEMLKEPVFVDESWTLTNHPACPRCGSEKTQSITDKGACLCRCNCWSHPECLDCGFTGYMNSEGIFWHK